METNLNQTSNSSVPSNKNGKIINILISLGIILLFAGLALFITGKLKNGYGNDALVEGKILGIKISFLGEIAIFFGIFLLFLKSIKMITGILTSMGFTVIIALATNSIISHYINSSKEFYAQQLNSQMALAEKANQEKVAGLINEFAAVKAETNAKTLKLLKAREDPEKLVVYNNELNNLKLQLESQLITKNRIIDSLQNLLPGIPEIIVTTSPYMPDSSALVKKKTKDSVKIEVDKVLETVPLKTR